MVEFFYKNPQNEVCSCTGTDFQNVTNASGVVLWIDICDPTGEEKRAVEAFLGSAIQSRAQAEEIESSSRYNESDTALFANTNFISPGPEDYIAEPVSFMVTKDVLTTLRENPIRSFTELQRRLMAFPQQYPNGYYIMTSILEQRVDRDADLVELSAKEISQYNKKVSVGEDISEEFLIDINQLQENIMMLRENIVDKQRLVTFLMKSGKFPKKLDAKINVVLKDINSLINHINFSFERLEYLQNTVIGIINLDQNKIMKVFTLVSLLLMPPTLITSFYGMNVKLPIIGETLADPIIVIVLMVASTALVLWLLKRKKML